MRQSLQAVRLGFVRMLALGGLAVLGLGLGLGHPAAIALAAPPAPGGKSPPSAQLIYGTIVAEGGKHYSGVIRWGDEEAFWDDLFNGSKQELPYIDRLPESEKPRRSIKILGFLPVGFWEENEQGRQFVARFGDIREIRPLGGKDVEVEVKDGATYRLFGGSNDVGTDIQIEDKEAGNVELKWRQIESIRFEPDPAGAPVPKAQRMFGEVETSSGKFTGFIQWDSQECLSTDLIDGDDAKGRVSLEMGKIQSIEKADGDAVRVQTVEGQKLELRGTNDVNSSIRGILVEDPRYGRVKVSWDAFRRIEFRQAPASGRTYAEYPTPRALKGKVTDRDGKTWQGTIVYDLDESETFEMLDGTLKGVEYSIPFERIGAIQPKGDKTAVVTLRNGQTLQLGEAQDVSDKNSGVLVLTKGTGPDQERYIPWGKIAKIELD